MAQTIEQRLQGEHPNARVAVLETDSSGPYKTYDVMIRTRIFAFNDQYPQDNRCICGHAYYRHFDPYENDEPVGCKHCSCHHFVHEEGAGRMSPFERMQKFGQWNVVLQDYLVQWEQLGQYCYPTIDDYLGASVAQWEAFCAPPPRQSQEPFADEHWCEVV